MEKKYLTLRNGAKIGNKIYVTGILGGSISGKHLSFIPRVKEARYLVKNFHPTAMIDISDGLLADLKRVCERSKLGARIYQKKIPLSKEVSLEDALTAGEDFELLFSLSRKYAHLAKSSKVHITQIGEITKKGIVLLDEKGKNVPLGKEGFNHFR